MKNLFALILLGISFNVTAQDPNYDCEKRIKTTIDQFTGTKSFQTPTLTNMRPFKTIYGPIFFFSKNIFSDGTESYHMVFSVSGRSYIEGNNCTILFENNKRLEKTTEVRVKEYQHYGNSYHAAYNSYTYSTVLPLDSADLELLRYNKIKAIRLVAYDIEEIKVPEFYMYYLNCLMRIK